MKTQKLPVQLITIGTDKATGKVIFRNSRLQYKRTVYIRDDGKLFINWNGARSEVFRTEGPVLVHTDRWTRIGV